MSEKFIYSYTNTTWVNKAGLVYLEYATKETPAFSLKDIIVMVKFIENNLVIDLYNFRDNILSVLPCISPSFEDLVKFDKETPIMEKRVIRDSMNKVISNYIETIAKYIKKYDRDVENEFIQKLLEFSHYTNNTDKLNHGQLVWEIMREIAKKIPQDLDNPYVPIQPSMSNN